MSFSLSPVAELAVKYVNTTQRNVFLTGKAGSGKTTLLKYIIENTFKNAVVAAPTGIAAINAGGVTLHSLLQLPFGTFIPEDIQFDYSGFHDKVNTPSSVVADLHMNSTKRALLKEIELLIIDEVSMLRADLLDCIDLILKTVRRRRNEHFGGVQVLFIGDLNQLPPVVKNSEWPLISKYYNSAYFFDSRVLRSVPPVFIELDKIYRQEDATFIDILNRLRENQLLKMDVDILNSHFKKDFTPDPEEGFIHITTHNRKSDILNKKELDKLEGKVHNYQAKVSGDFPENMFPLPENIVLKEDAQVMFIKNDPENKFFNGKIGRIYKLDKDYIDVQLSDFNEVVRVKTHVWENKRYKLNASTNEVEENLIGSFEQYPIKLAWAITVHKSQGLTFERAILDLTDSFAPGQMYVALSRLTSLNGLVLSTPIPEHGFEIDHALSAFVKSKKAKEILQNELKIDCKQFLINYISNGFDFGELQSELKYHLESFNKDENRSIKQKYFSWTQEFAEEIENLQEVAEKFGRQIRNIASDESVNYRQTFTERVEKAGGYFIPIIESLSSKIKAHKREVGRKQQVKTYSKELKALESLVKKHKLKIEKVKLLLSYVSKNIIPTRKDVNAASNSAAAAGKGSKKSKVNTREVTLKMYKQGLTIADIAEKRDLSPTTIEGHIAANIANGLINIFDLIETEKIDQILTVANKLDTTLLNEIKAKLGDEFSYGDIKMALAYKKSMTVANT